MARARLLRRVEVSLVLVPIWVVRFAFRLRFVDFMGCRLVRGDTLMRGGSKFTFFDSLAGGGGEEQEQESADLDDLQSWPGYREIRCWAYGL